MKRLFIIIIFTAIAVSQVLAQANLSGKVKDSRNGDCLIGATVLLEKAGNTQPVKSTITDPEGVFVMRNIDSGNYTLNISYIGYKTYTKSISIGNKNINIEIELKEDNQILDEVSVNGRATRAEQKGDSLIYNAEAFKVMDGSNAESLLSKMPGIVVEGGTIQAQGEDVKKILVDGKEFFDGDINLAIKNLPSDVIASIEVFDKQSEQAEFSGFDDGEQIKTINIITKTGFKLGTFGRIYAGYGTDNRYNAGGNINFFNDDRRISILGMSNNINSQNFSQEDIAGVMSANSFKGGGKGQRMGGGSASKYSFMTGNLNGVTASDGIGLNYVDRWNNKMSFTGSYFFNHSNNTNQKNTDRDYFESALPGMSYNEFYNAQMNNFNHRINIKYDYNIDKRNSLTIRPSISLQDNSSNALTDGWNMLEDVITNKVNKHNTSDVLAYNVGGSIDFRHRFAKPGRTFSVNFRGNMSNNSNDTYNDYLKTIYSPAETTNLTSQYKDNNTKTVRYNGNIMYTDLIAKNLQIQANYRISYSNSSADKITYDKSPVTDLYEMMNEELSNIYESDYMTHSGGIGLRYRLGKLNISGEANIQYSSLLNTQTYPESNNTSRNFFAVLPKVNVRYQVDRNNSFMFRYNSNTSSPSISDLQNIINNSNPLFISAGNPDLKQQVNHMMNLRYVLTTKTGHSFIAMLGSTIRQDYITDSTFVAKESIKLNEEITLDKGAQFTRPVNSNGYYSFQSLVTYGFPVDFIRSNLNFSIATNTASVPVIFDGVKSSTNEINIIPKVVIGSNISTKLDFTLSYSSGINLAYSSADSGNKDKYINHNGQFKFGWEFWKGFTLNSVFNYVGYTGLESESINYYLWNVSIGKKFLKNNACEINLSAFDILRQNKSFVRNVGGNYYEYVTGNVIEPYFMLSVVYNIR